MKIGSVEIYGLTALAPLAGVTDIPFRLMCKEAGAPIVFSEMVSSEGLVRGSEKTNRYLEFLEEERPVALQIFGSDPEVMSEAAKIVEERGPDIIDINFGCPVKKVVKNNAGSALLKDPKLMGKIVSAIVKAVSLPVTAKIRSGWDEKTSAVQETGKILEDSGISAITIHPRTRKQQFKGKADWTEIVRLKNAVSVPVIGNGDIIEPKDAQAMFDETGCDMVMIGRASMGKPWIFREIANFLSKGEELPQLSHVEIIEICLKQYNISVDIYGERYAFNTMKKHIAWYLKGMPGNSAVKNSVFTARDTVETRNILMKYADDLKNLGPEFDENKLAG
ncbi:MAG: tRNA dihydrouridine synthase DusB [bacterium]|nr:tRNA dihydrouridine synthase DusB [bacterium]